MVYNGINFYPVWKGRKLEDFMKHEKHHGLSDDQMKEAWDLLQKDGEKKEEKKASDK